VITRRRHWVLVPLLGAGVGILILGIGGRVAMRAIAHATNVAPAFTLSGTLTVAALGGVSGLAGGLIYAVLARFLPNRALVRSLLFGVILVLITLRGLSPATALSISWFMPLVLLYGALIDYAYRRRFSSAPEVHLEPGVHEPPIVAER
jgi:putative exporter of polyketide antibiotics